MGTIFDKLLIDKEILSEEELKFYKDIQSKQSEKDHLGKLLHEKGLIDEETLKKLLNEAKNIRQEEKQKKKKDKDKKVLSAVKELGLIRSQEIEECLKQQKETGDYLVNIFLKGNYLTSYLARKLYRKGTQRVKLPKGITKHEDLVVNIPQYLKDRLLGKIAVKNKLITQEQLEETVQTLKEKRPHSKLVAIFREKKLIKSNKLKAIEKVLKKWIRQKYPFLKEQIQDISLAKKLISVNFLSPWRINKCLMHQFEMLKLKEYISLRQILEKDGFLCSYQFDTVLDSKEELEEFVPKEKIRTLAKNEIEAAIHEAGSDVHLIIEEEDAESFNFSDSFSKEQAPASEIAVEEAEIQEVEEVGEEVGEEIEEIEEIEEENLKSKTKEEQEIEEIEEDIFEEIENLTELDEDKEVEFALVEGLALPEDEVNFILEETIEEEAFAIESDELDAENLKEEDPE